MIVPSTAWKESGVKIYIDKKVGKPSGETVSAHIAFVHFQSKDKLDVLE